MGISKNRLTSVGLFLGLITVLLVSQSAMACVGCGQTLLFSPKLLGITMSFIFLPVTIVTVVALKLRRDAKIDAALPKDGE